nr:MAG TPA: hypothetical protein [Caudoviricetes sp.]
MHHGYSFIVRELKSSNQGLRFIVYGCYFYESYTFRRPSIIEAT